MRNIQKTRVNHHDLPSKVKLYNFSNHAGIRPNQEKWYFQADNTLI